MPATDTAARIDTYLNDLSEQNTFSGSVLVAHNGAILLNKGYNLANREWDILNAPDTIFRIGSLTKQFTAMSILMLQERGSLSVEDHICQYVEDCPKAWTDITLRHLLTHTAGVYNLTNLPDNASLEGLEASPAQLIARFRNLPLDFEAGTSWDYSNSNYVLLGSVIETVAQQSYEAFVQANIFDPLRMSNSGSDSPTRIIRHRAEGYIDANTKATYLHMSNAYAAGGHYSTVEDLYKWDQALYSGKVVSQESWDAMRAAAAPLPADHWLNMFWNSYAYGLGTGKLGGHPAMGHEGGINGFRSSVYHLSDDNATVVVLSNFEPIDTHAIAAHVVEALFGVP